jgi:hypothetical protein
MQNNFHRLPRNFVYQQDFIVASAYNNLLYTSDHYIDLYGDPNYIQDKYEIDSTTNTFTRLNSWQLFGTGPDEINSFTILSISQAPYIFRRYDYSIYSCNVSFGYFSKFFVFDNNVYVAHTNEKIYYTNRVTTDSIIFKIIDFFPTKVDEITVELNQFNLSQNYPNPFNPSTNIQYSVPQSSNVVIKVFDILGNELETLVKEEKPAGTYEIAWFAEQLPSGIYFYRLQVGSFVETKKMLLLK